MYNIFFQPVKSIIPMKETAEKALKRLGINNLRDLLFYGPYTYNISDNSSELRNLETGTLGQAEITIDAIDLPRLKRLPTKIYTSNDTGELVLVFFNKIPPFIFSRLKEGNKCIVSGKVQKFDGFYQINPLLDESSRRLTIKELFANQVSLTKLKKAEKQVVGHKFPVDFELQKRVVESLGFVFTDTQENAIKEIQLDQASGVQMMRLLQGDVGAGKTLIALMTMLNPIKDRFQAALMVPTDLLSVQHFQFFQKALEGANIKCALLTGNTKIKERREISASLKSGDIDILIGTHAYISGVG